MEITHTGMMLHPSPKDGRVMFGIYLNNYWGNGEIDDALNAWQDEEEIGINLDFYISECLDSMIEIYEYQGLSTTVISEEYRPAFAALRAELAETIARIDSLQFSAEYPSHLSQTAGR